MLKQFVIDYYEKDIRNKVLLIRSRVIHVNNQSTGKKAHDAYTSGENSLKEYNIPIAINNKYGSIALGKLHKARILGNNKISQLGSFEIGMNLA